MDGDVAGPARKRKRSLNDASQQRRRSDEGVIAEGSNSNAPISIDKVDEMGEDDPISETLHRQRQEQVASQQNGGDKAPKITEHSCVICMDTPSDLTATVCGHLFCFECLEQSLRASEKRSSDSRKSNCPVCRKVLQRKKKNDVIPLLFAKRPA